MALRRTILCFLLLLNANSFAQQVRVEKLQSPAAFLGYKLGEKFTYHYRIADYFNYVAKHADNVKLVQYGLTPEGRPLLAAFAGSAENIKRLEQIRAHNLSLTGLEKSPAITNPPVILWLSYNVHGNEPASAEVAMKVLYDLADPENKRVQQWLKNTIVVIDPCLNPDGHERYVNYYYQAGGTIPNTDTIAREHREPWPGGRYNHYYFDLNRDWAWQVQPESQARLALYNKWLPQIHVDFHEQNFNSPYYFAPAAEPFHKVITPWQRSFQNIIGKNNAKYFDQQQWMYFTHEEFDLLYPSYGDTYPLYNGAIGMTYEQGGINAGLSVITKDGDTLTLADRIAHHYTSSLSTIETASNYAPKLLTEYEKFFTKSSSAPAGEFKTYIIKNDNQDKINALKKLLDRNQIKYAFGLHQQLKGFSYTSGNTETFTVTDSDMVINSAQPKSVLLNVLLEPKTFVADSNTYDITAWSLPYAYGLQAYALKEPVKIADPIVGWVTYKDGSINESAVYAYVCNWQSVEDAQFLAELLKKNIKVRYAEKEFEAYHQKFSAGSLIITRAGNNMPDFSKIVNNAAAKYHRKLNTFSSGIVDKGPDVGSRTVHLINKPKVLLVTNEGTSAESAGEIWHFFEQEINYPVTLARYQDLTNLKLYNFDVIVLPEGLYPDMPVDKLQDWIKNGGKLIAMGNAISKLTNKKGFTIKAKNSDELINLQPIKPSTTVTKTYGKRSHDALSLSVPGAIYKVKLDNTHPLGYGLPDYYYTLKLNDDLYNYLGDNGWNVGTLQKKNYVAGFVGDDSKSKLKEGMLLGVQTLGQGTIVYMVDDPLFRGFWENGKLLFSNAVFMVQ